MELNGLFLRVRCPLLALAISWSIASTTWADGGCQCNGDVANDGGVNVIDLAVTIGCAGGNCAGCVNDCDVNCDGSVDYVDVGAVFCQFVQAADCCNEPIGACVGAVNLPGCVDTTQPLCENPSFNGAYVGDGTTCDIPATSEWGLAVLALLLLTAGSLLARSRVTPDA